MSNEKTIEILEHLLLSVKTIGYNKTLSVLKVEKVKEDIQVDGFEEFLINTILNEFEITKDELLYSRYIRGDLKYAVGFCVYFLYDKKSLGHIQKKIFQYKNKTLLSKYRQMITDLRADSVADESYIIIKNSIENKIKQYKK
jgi:hypothetical protein